MVVKQSAYDSAAGRPPKQPKKKLLGGLAGRLKRNGIVRRDSSLNTGDESFDGSFSKNGIGTTATASLGGPPPTDVRGTQSASFQQASTFQDPAQVVSQETFHEDRKDEVQSRVAASSFRSDAEAASRTRSPRNLPNATPSKSASKPKKTLVITSRKALYDPEVRAEVTRLYNLIHRVNSGPSAAPSSSQAPGGRPMYASTTVTKTNARYGRQSRKAGPSSSRNHESLDDDSLGRRPPRKLRVIKCPLVDNSGNPFDKEELSSIGSVLGSSKVSSARKDAPTRLSSSVLQCLGVDSDTAHANHRSLARQPEEDSGVRISSDDGLPVEKSPDPAPKFCGLFSVGSTPTPDASGPQGGTVPKSISIDPITEASFFPSFWDLFEVGPKETVARSTVAPDFADVENASSQATDQQGDSNDDMERLEDNISEDCRDDTAESVAREEQNETSVEVEMDRRDDANVGANARSDDDDSPMPKQVVAPESDLMPHSKNKVDQRREPRHSSSSRQSERLPEAKASHRGSFSWFRRNKKQVEKPVTTSASSPIIYLNAPRQAKNEGHPLNSCDFEQSEGWTPAIIQDESMDNKNETVPEAKESKNGDKGNDDDIQSPSASPHSSAILQQESHGGDETETSSAREKSRSRHSFKRTPSLISVKSLRTLVSTTSGCASAEESNRRREMEAQNGLEPVSATASKESSRCAEREDCSKEASNVQQSTTSSPVSETQQDADSSQSYLLGYLLAQLAFQRESRRSGDMGSKQTDECKVLDPVEGMTLSEIMLQLQKHHSPRLSKDYLTYILTEFARHACTVDRAALQQGYVQRLSKRPAALQSGPGAGNVAPHPIIEQVVASSQDEANAPTQDELPMTSFSQESSKYRVSRVGTASRSCVTDVASDVGEPHDSVAGSKFPASRWTCFQLGACCGPVTHANSMTDDDLDDIAAAVETTIDALRGDVADESSGGSSDAHSQNDTSEHDMGAWFDFLDGKEESYYSSAEFVDEDVDVEAGSVASDDIMHPSSTLSRCY